MRLQRAVTGAVLAILVGVPFLLDIDLVRCLTVGMLALLLGLTLFWRIGWLGGARAVQSALWKSDGRWLLFNSGGSWEATLSPASQRLGGFVRLRFVADRGPRELLLRTTALGPFLRRTLQVRLELHAHARPEAGGQAPRQAAEDVR